MKIYRHQGIVYVEPKGEISFLTVGEIKRQIYGFLEEDDKNLVMELTKVDFIDSAGLGLLISLLKNIKERGGKVVLRYPKLGVQRLLEITRMDELFEVEKAPETKTGSWNEFLED